MQSSHQEYHHHKLHYTPANDIGLCLQVSFAERLLSRLSTGSLSLKMKMRRVNPKSCGTLDCVCFHDMFYFSPSAYPKPLRQKVWATCVIRYDSAVNLSKIIVVMTDCGVWNVLKPFMSFSSLSFLDDLFVLFEMLLLDSLYIKCLSVNRFDMSYYRMKIFRRKLSCYEFVPRTS